MAKEPSISVAITKVKTISSNRQANARSQWPINLDIDTDHFLKVLQRDGKSYIYSFAIREQNSKGKFRNLVLKEVKGGYRAMILEYTSIDSDLQNLSSLNNFSGVITRYNLEGKLLRSVTVKNGNQVNPESIVGISVQSTTSASYCFAYLGTTPACIPSDNTLPTEAPGDGQGLGGCEWTLVHSFESVPCPDSSGGSSDGGDGGNNSGTYIGSEPSPNPGPGGGGGSDPYDGGPNNPGDGTMTYPEDIGTVEPYITTDEGAEAGDGFDAAYWSNPNLVFPAQNLPSYASFNSAYPRNRTGLQVFTMVGGEPLEIAQKEGNYNACALRVSLALNYSGIIIPNIPKQTFKGSDGKYYFLGAQNMQEWMIRTFGPANVSVNASQAGLNGNGFKIIANNRKGIYFMRPEYPAVFRASGHADIFDGTSFDVDGYFGRGYFSGMLWVLE